MKHAPLKSSRRRVPLPGSPSEACPRLRAGVLDEAHRPESLWVTGEDAATEPLRRRRCRHRSRDLSGNLLQVFPVFVVGLVVLASCGGETPTGVDRTAPSSVEDLHLIVSDQTSVTVGWTAPGDDGDKGQASGYDLRYGVVPPQVDWDVASRVEAVPLPGPAGTMEEVTVGGLDAATKYYFALKVQDEAGNVSAVSNLIRIRPGDDAIPPAAVSDLHVVSRTDQSLEVGWSATGDDGEVGRAAGYDLRYSYTSLAEAGVAWERAVKVPGLPQPGEAGTEESVCVKGLYGGRVHFFRLRVRDDQGLWSPLSNQLEATTLDDEVAPAAVTDLRVSVVNVTSGRVAWTATGDDGFEGRAWSYDLRIAEEAVTEGTWSGAERVSQVPRPEPSGTGQEAILAQLEAGTTYYVAMKVLDEMGNESGLSNGVTITTRSISTAWNVYADGTGDAPTIQATIDTAGSGDLILVHPGTYVENINFRGKNIHLKSTAGPEETILDGSSQELSVVTINSGETREAVLEGFTITGGRGTTIGGGALVVGGGVVCIDASPSIVGNIIKDNQAGFPNRGTGGGIWIDTDALETLVNSVVRGNVFQGNKAATNGGAVSVTDAIVDLIGNRFVQNEARFDGGAILVAMGLSGMATIRDNEFIENVAGDHGGGIEAGHSGLSSPPLQIEGNLFVRNEAHGDDLPSDSGTGGGISMRGWAGTIAHNTFVGSIGTGGVSCSGGAILVSQNDKGVRIIENIFASSQGCALRCEHNGSNIDILNNLFWSNAPKDVGDPPNCFGDWEPTNLFQDPLFCDPGSDDYHVRSDSPAITGGNQVGAYLEPGCEP